MDPDKMYVLTLAARSSRSPETGLSAVETGSAGLTASLTG